MSESKWRAAMAEALSEHAADGSDEQRVNGEWTWGLNCDCGEFVPDAEVNAHLADALSPVLAQMKREWQAEAWDEGREQGQWDGIPGRQKPNPYRAEASGQEPT